MLLMLLYLLLSINIVIELDKSIQSPNHHLVLGAYRPPISNHPIINVHVHFIKYLQ